MRNFIAVFAAFIFMSACTPKEISDLLGVDSLSAEDVAMGLKEALERGSRSAGDELSRLNGYYESPYKILLPEEVQKITNTLSVVPGFTNLEDELIKRLNRAAEDAAAEAAPIFVGAIRQMTINDAWNILKGDDRAATSYLQNKTQLDLYNRFQPVIYQSLEEVKAVSLWSDAVSTYNKIPLVEKLNPSLDDYVTQKALNGLFEEVAKEEKAIRKDPSKRVTDLLRRVFAEQD